MVFVRSLVLSYFQFLFLFSLFSLTFTTCFPLTHPKCHPYESHALLQFKEDFTINKTASDNPLSYPKTTSWNATTDCCTWGGIKCDEHTDHVIHINLRSSQLYGTMNANSTLFRLVHLRHLDLSDNDFNYSQIPSKIGELSQLRYLNLSRTVLFGEIPPQVSQLSKLLSLDLSVYARTQVFKHSAVNMLQLKQPIIRSIVKNSTKLEMLYLDYVTISSTLPDTITNLTSLIALSVERSELYGEFPVGVFHLPNLKFLNLRYNPNLNGSLPEFHSSSLTKLFLDGTDFYGTLPLSIGKLSSLRTLSIEDCNFSGYIPSSLGNLTQLMRISLRDNQFVGDPSVSLANLTKLNFLAVGYNKFTFETISWIGKLSSLIDLSISSLNIGSDIPLSFANLTQLSMFDAFNSNIKGEFPSWLTNLTDLVFLSLQNNFLHGKLELDMFLKLKKLVVLDLSYNKLSLFNGKSSYNATNSPIMFLYLASCNIVAFPTFIRNLTEVEFIQLAHNNITSLPSWLWRKSSLKDLVVSYNSLAGEISPSICNLKSLMILDLSFNKFSGHIPSCIGNFSQYLEFLDLKGNKLSGLIPQSYLMGNNLQMIDFSNNNLQGQLPRALVNCGWLEYFDISHNNINDSFPFWLGDLPELKVLDLRNNKFHGEIRCSSNMTCTFPKLHIIDLSHNEFSGSFPTEIVKSWKAMKTSNTSQLQYDPMLSYNSEYGYLGIYFSQYNSYSFTMSNKGHTMVYKKLQNFYSMIAIDISSNKISGEIPKVIGELKGLVLLNLSNNIFTGSIPSSLGNLSNLEALDLSLNSLSGKIPQQLTQLTFLEFFNVSFNNLSGPIPQNQQFSTFQGDSFEGNKGLCGDQLVQKCLDNAHHSFSPPSTSDGDHDSESFFEIEWKVSLIGYVGGLVAGVALGTTYSSQVLRWLKRFF